MAKQVREVTLNNRTARMKLVGRKKPYFRAVQDGLHLGYKRSTVARKAGTWLARRYLGDERYQLHHLGTADDFAEMPVSANAMTFDEALSAAKQWAAQQVRADRAAITNSGAPTVRNAIEAYILARKARSERDGRDAELRLGRHVLGSALADTPLPNLTEAMLAAWRAGLKRGGRGVQGDPPALAPSTVTRLSNDLKAALRSAAHKARLGGDFASVIKDGLATIESGTRARPMQVLNDADVRRVCEAARQVDPDFGDLALLLAATGARFDQIARLTVADFQPEQRRLMIPTSAKGRGAKQITHIAAPIADDVVARLKVLTVGRHAHEPLLMRWAYKQVPGDKAVGKVGSWARDRREAWKASDQVTRPWAGVIASTGLPMGTTCYSLRHSSIVRSLRAGLPVKLVASLHDTSVAMIERHYGRFIVDASEDLLRRALVSLAPAATANLRLVGGQ